MSKISEYQKALRLKEDESETQTVGEFAIELRKSTAVLLQQLKEAGISKQETDPLTGEDKHKFLKHLQSKHKTSTPRKK